MAISVDIPRVHYRDSEVLVSTRNPGEWHVLQEFINPYDPQVQKIYQAIGPDPWALLDWVCRNVNYRSDNGEWWAFPAETLTRLGSDGKPYGDCDDSAALTCSLIRNFANCYEVVGSYRKLGHAWVQIDGQILETTYSYAHPVPDPQNYRAYAMFNDEEVIELWPGAMSQLFQLARNEKEKLAMMTEINENITASTWGITLLSGVLASFIGSMLVTIFIRR